MCARVCVSACACVSVYVCVRMCAHVCVCVCCRVYIFRCLIVHICICLHMHCRDGLKSLTKSVSSIDCCFWEPSQDMKSYQDVQSQTHWAVQWPSCDGFRTALASLFSSDPHALSVTYNNCEQLKPLMDYGCCVSCYDTLMLLLRHTVLWLLVCPSPTPIVFVLLSHFSAWMQQTNNVHLNN